MLAPELFDTALLVASRPYVVLEGRLQNVQGARTVRAERIEPLELPVAAPASHDLR